jgi:2-amino-4-hydroxy-6-hydroxymethyldihydropteridine diphosphokinase
MARVYVSIGSNIEPQRYVRIALAELQQRYGTLIQSRVYGSQTIGFQGDPFYNLVVGFDTTESVQTVNQSLREIEQRNGRQHHAMRFSSRTLDLDLLLYNDLILDEPAIPRPEITQYAFVLRPLAEIAPTLQHPMSKQCYAELWHAFDQTQQPLWPVVID